MTAQLPGDYSKVLYCKWMLHVIRDDMLLMKSNESTGTDVPLLAVWRNGRLSEVTQIIQFTQYLMNQTLLVWWHLQQASDSMTVVHIY